MSNPRADTHLLASLRADDGKGTVRLEDVYDTTPADLWSALTQPDRLARWIGEVTGDLRPGGRFHARFTSTWEGAGRIDVCDPHRHLRTTMDPGSEEETTIEATLTAEGPKTRLVIEERGLPLHQVAAYGAGWQAHAEDLTAHLADREPGR